MNNRSSLDRRTAAPAARRGRPRKFAEPSRPVTLTLPLDVIAALGAVDTDLSRAVVRMVRPALGRRRHPPAELSNFGSRAVIVIHRSRTLERRAGVCLVPLPDGRALISFDRPTTIEGLELTIADALEDPRLDRADRAVFEGIGDILRSARRSRDVAMLQKSIIVLRTVRASKTRTA